MAVDFMDVAKPSAAELAKWGDHLRFLELVAEGCPQGIAAESVGWSPRKARRELSIPEFFDAVQAAKDRADDSIEYALYREAKKGNMTAIQMWLYNRRAQEWRDVKRIEVRTSTEIDVQVVHSVKAGAIETLREMGVGAMQQLSAAVIETHGSEVTDGGDSDD